MVTLTGRGHKAQKPDCGVRLYPITIQPQPTQTSKQHTNKMRINVYSCLREFYLQSLIIMIHLEVRKM